MTSWESGHRREWYRTEVGERILAETVKEVGTEAVAGVIKTVGNIPVQNSGTYTYGLSLSYRL